MRLSRLQWKALDVLAANYPPGEKWAYVEGHSTQVHNGSRIVHESTARSLEALGLVEQFPCPGYEKANGTRYGTLYWACRLTEAGAKLHKQKLDQVTGR